MTTAAATMTTTTMTAAMSVNERRGNQECSRRQNRGNYSLRSHNLLLLSETCLSGAGSERMPGEVRRFGKT